MKQHNICLPLYLYKNGVTKVGMQETILFCLIYFMMYIRNKHKYAHCITLYERVPVTPASFWKEK